MWESFATGCTSSLGWPRCERPSWLAVWLEEFTSLRSKELLMRFIKCPLWLFDGFSSKCFIRVNDWGTLREKFPPYIPDTETSAGWQGGICFKIRRSFGLSFSQARGQTPEFLAPAVRMSSSHNSLLPLWEWAPHIILCSHYENELLT